MRAVAVVVFLVAATLVPRGVPAGLMVMAAGIAAVLSSLWTNAGGPGEQAGARPQDRWFDAVRAPQGQWPPYDLGAVDDELAARPTSPEPSRRPETG